MQTGGCSMKRDPGAYLWDVVQGCRAIQDFLAGATYDRYQVDLMLKSAVERQLINIGEALAQLTRLLTGARANDVKPPDCLRRCQIAPAGRRTKR